MQKIDKPYRVGLWPVPGYAMMSCASVIEPLRAANLLAGKTVYDITIFAPEEGAASSGGAVLPGTHRPGDMPDLNLMLVIAGGDPFAFDDSASLRWLRGMAEKVPVLGGVSGGPVLLAQAGLLVGRQCTVHWEHAEAFSKQFPDVVIKRRLFFMERDRVTCGGGTAPMDLMHAMIARHYGKAFARQVSDWFLHTDIRAASAPQKGRFTDQLGHAPQAVFEAVAVMEDHIGDPVSLSQLGLITGTSPRHLNRLFDQVFQTPVMAFYRKMRLKVGKSLLQKTDLSVADIADATGFFSASHFSQQFVLAFGMRPAVMRENKEQRLVVDIDKSV